MNSKRTAKINTLAGKDELLRVANRIQQQRRELDERSNALKERIERIRADNNNGINSFNAADLLRDDQTLSSLARQKERLDNAKKLPNYADAEFRELSIPFVNALAEEKTARAEELAKQIEKAQAGIKELEEEIDNCRFGLRSLSGEWMASLREIGIYDRELFCPDVCDFTSFVRDYKELCAKFE